MTTPAQPLPPLAVTATDVPLRSRPSNYPKAVQDMLATRLSGRSKRQLGDYFGLSNFGVNLTRLAPGAASALRHAHLTQDEFVYVLEGRPTLHTGDAKLLLEPGMCAGFKAGDGRAHCFTNDTAEDVVFLEVGDRSPGDVATYPDDDLAARIEGGAWTFTHKDGTPFTDPAP
jgi:uncharacterized cupin superfamily protein